MKAFTTSVLASLAMAATAAVSQAAITAPFSESFNSGLGLWTATGDVAVQSAGGNSTAVLTTAFNAEQDDFPLPAGALNISGSATSMAGGDLEAFCGLAAGALDLDSLSQATEGSALKAVFSLAAGGTISFDWQLASRDSAAGQDYAFVTINGMLVNLATAADATHPGTGNYLTQTDVTHFEYVAPGAGDYTVAFGVTDVGDYSGTTSLSIDNVLVTVPEASSSLLALTGLSLAALRRKR